MPNNEPPHPFSWLPKPGEFANVPGGALWCESWVVNTHADGVVDGEIRFRFHVEAEAYWAATKKPAALPCAKPLEIDSPNNPGEQPARITNEKGQRDD